MPRCNGKPEAFKAVETCNVGLMLCLVKSGGDLKLLSWGGNSLLALAIKHAVRSSKNTLNNSSLEIIKLLVENDVTDIHSSRGRPLVDLIDTLSPKAKKQLQSALGDLYNEISNTNASDNSNSSSSSSPQSDLEDDSLPKKKPKLDMFAAVKQGDLKTINRAIQNGQDLNQSNSEEVPLIYHAVKYALDSGYTPESLNIIKALVANGAKVLSLHSESGTEFLNVNVERGKNITLIQCLNGCAKNDHYISLMNALIMPSQHSVDDIDEDEDEEEISNYNDHGIVSTVPNNSNASSSSSSANIDLSEDDAREQMQIFAAVDDHVPSGDEMNFDGMDLGADLFGTMWESDQWLI